MSVISPHTVSPLIVDTITRSVESSIETILSQLPTIILVAAILVVGAVAADRVKGIVERYLASLSLTDRLEGTPIEGAIGDDQTIAKPAGLLAQFYVILFAILFAAGIADITTVSRWAEVLILYIPELIGGGLIIFLGLLLGNIAATRMRSAPVIEDSEYGDWIVAVVKSVVYFIAGVIGLDMIGFELQIVYLIVEGIVSAIGLGIAAAIALAIGVAAGFYAKDHVVEDAAE